MIIDNVKIYTEAGTFVSGGIITQGDKITEIYTEAEKENIFKKNEYGNRTYRSSMFGTRLFCQE